ncbi:DEAD/DEAH box helicase [Thalassotalea sp. G20_0]|uniref:DEAD/DEAH box helicase n=1 Tax=Thalassotalea sp. G20_0 TaxID=2821093 RepID=UPI001ADB14AE|nr:DEAD/DEAH box helicase [Thalassotalea sp. G20_0]MBO9492945.1 DEAD/DEAH box helicase [Thalassotalea sp. G20_0]
MTDFQSGVSVSHPDFGSGVVEICKGETTLVRFEHGIEECLTSQLSVNQGLSEAILAGNFHPVKQVACRSLALTLRSVNDSWGVFSRSKISLLPHQLWVCHRTLRQWPACHLIADDVGLGKTIEAGLILWPLLAKKRVRRLLVLTPAPLVEQWQERLRQMFDIRLSIYSPQSDTARSDYWNSHHQVVASLPTLRKDVNGRHQRMLEAEDWDLLIIDEAHHLNFIEDEGATQGYRFVEKLISHDKFDSRLFFSGTPHRGKDYGFFALMRLLRADLFDPENMSEAQMRENLSQVLIRNNKQNVTDMAGKRLFKPVKVMARTYAYSPEEQAFYEKLSNFILSGQAYASSLNSRDQKAVMLVLITMQKLASSSVAAVRQAIRGRICRHQQNKARLGEIESRQEKIVSQLDGGNSEGADIGLSDEIIALEEEFAAISVKVQLMDDELPRMEELLEAAEKIQDETRMGKIIDILEDDYKGRSVVFFTEYKATQALLVSELLKKYGDGCVSFINGDSRIEGVRNQSGDVCAMTMDRYTAAQQFNTQKVRFIVSTEAGGEGIDLQDHCYSMIHVDLPWNPMRLHQRVGRLNRYGQQEQVEVITLRNPDTVESRIWDLLNSKIERIMMALGNAMEEPEDLMQLILGMSDQRIFNEIFGQSLGRNNEKLADWFDVKTQTIGGQSVIDKVKDMVGRAEKFDCSDLKDVPKLDLQELKPFFESMLVLNNRRPKKGDHAISFKAPKEWQTDLSIQRVYENISFDRTAVRNNKDLDVIGFGHPVFGKAVDQALDFKECLCLLKGKAWSLVLFTIRDRVTGSDRTINIVTVGVHKKVSGELSLLKGEETVNALNNALSARQIDKDKAPDSAVLIEFLESSREFLMGKIDQLGLPFQLPDVEPVSMVYSVDC